MIDVEPVIRDELNRIYPQPGHDPDWGSILAAAELGPGRRLASSDTRSRRRAVGAPASTWRWRLSLGAVALVAIAVAAALLPTALTDRGRVTIVDRALAAVSTGPVLHAVLEVPTTAVASGPEPESEHLTVLDLGTGQERPSMFRMEFWYDTERRVMHLTYGSEGAVFDSLLSAESTQSNQRGARPADGPPRIDPGLAAFFTGYRQALEDGTATISGDTVIAGRAVTWLRFPPDRAGGSPQEVAVDSESYEAVATRSVCPECTEAPRVYRILTLEGISRDRADFSTPAAPAQPRVAAYGKAGRETIALADAAAALGRVPVWPGPSVGGLALSGVLFVTPARYSGSPPTRDNLIDRGRALQLFYGGKVENGRFSAMPDEPTVTVSVSADWMQIFAGFNFDNAAAGQPLTSAMGAVPPEGEAALTSFQEGYWTAQLRKRDLYVEIDGSSRDLVVEAARALRDVPRR